jgi:hypothetical protein
MARGRPSSFAVAGAVALLALTATGCKVDVPDTDVSGADRSACEALVDALPGSVSEQSRRATKGNPLGAAWGDPAIVLRCGVGKPADYDPLVGCQTANGLDWFVPKKAIDDQGADIVMTTIGRRPAVEVRLPATYRPPVAAMVDLGNAIKQHTRASTPCR